MDKPPVSKIVKNEYNSNCFSFAYIPDYSYTALLNTRLHICIVFFCTAAALLSRLGIAGKFTSFVPSLTVISRIIGVVL